MRRTGRHQGRREQPGQAHPRRAQGVVPGHGARGRGVRHGVRRHHAGRAARRVAAAGRRPGGRHRHRRHRVRGAPLEAAAPGPAAGRAPRRGDRPRPGGVKRGVNPAPSGQTVAMTNEDESGRHETEEERLDRKWGDLLQELRVMQTGRAAHRRLPADAPVPAVLHGPRPVRDRPLPHAGGARRSHDRAGDDGRGRPPEALRRARQGAGGGGRSPDHVLRAGRHRAADHGHDHADLRRGRRPHLRRGGGRRDGPRPGLAAGRAARVAGR